MRLIKKNLMLSAITVIAFCLLFIFQCRSVYAETKALKTETLQGNSAGNIVCGGIAAYDEKYAYYRNASDGGKLYRCIVEGRDSKKICDDSVHYINVYKGWIYYSNDSDGKMLYKIKTDGTQRKKITTDGAENLIVSEDWIYYADTGDLGNIYRIKTDGTGRMKLTFSKYEKRGMSDINVAGKFIYYIDGYTNYICRIGIDGKSLKQYNQFADELIINDGRMYFTDVSSEMDGYVLCRMTIEGTNKKQISDVLVERFNLKGTRIYYTTNFTEDLGIWRMSTEGGETQWLVKEDAIFEYNTVGEYIYIVDKAGTKIIKASEVLSFIKPFKPEEAYKKAVELGWLKSGEKMSRNITRKEFSEILARFDKEWHSDADNSGGKSFSDVSKDNAYFKYIESQKQYIPFQTGLFKPDSMITREDAVTAVLKSFEYDGSKAVNFGISVGDPHFLEDYKLIQNNYYIGKAVKYSLVNIDKTADKAYLRPKDFIRLDELAFLMFNVYQKGDFSQYKDIYMPIDFPTDIKDKNFDTALQAYFKGSKWLCTEALNTCIEENPNNATAYYDRALLLSEDEPVFQYDEILKLYDSAIKLDPNYEKAYFNKGSVLCKQGKYTEAQKCYEQVLKLNKNNSKAYYALGNLQSALESYSEAISNFDMAIGINPMNYKAYYEKGLAIINNKGELKQSMDCFDRSIEIEPEFMSPYYSKGYCLSDAKLNDDELKCYTAGLKINPKEFELYDRIFNVYYNMGKYDEALKAINTGIGILEGYFENYGDVNFDYGSMYYNKGTVLLKSGKAAEALECFTNGIEHWNGNADLNFGKGLACITLKKYEVAIEAFDTVIKKYPDEPNAYIQKANAYRMLKKYDLALKNMDKAVELDNAKADQRLALLDDMWTNKAEGIINNDKLKNELYDYYIKEIDNSLIAQNSSKAKDIGRKCLALAQTDEKKKRADFKMGVAAFANGDIKEAISYYQKSIALYEKAATENLDDTNQYLSLAYSNLALAEIYDKNFDTAITHAKKALEIEENVEYKMILANALLFGDRYSEALPIYNEISDDYIFDAMILQIKPLKVKFFPTIKLATVETFDSLKRYGISNKNTDDIIALYSHSI
jgi:tetratricopeptide (TPR) repeat protein